MSNLIRRFNTECQPTQLLFELLLIVYIVSVFLGLLAPYDSIITMTITKMNISANTTIRHHHMPWQKNGLSFSFSSSVFLSLFLSPFSSSIIIIIMSPPSNYDADDGCTASINFDISSSILFQN